MGILIKQYKGNMFGVWTTIADGYLTTPAKISKKDAIKVLCDRVDDRAKREKAEIRKNFPNGYCDKDTGLRIFIEESPHSTHNEVREK